MSVIAFEGAAGCGKTHRLIETVVEQVRRHPLLDGQRVLATTYMHGSRRRLAGRLRELDNLAGRYECSTLDSIAWRWVWRWRTLAEGMAGGLPSQRDFETVCALAARLLEQPAVRSWAVMSFPITLVDEAQDLTVPRLAIVQALAQEATVLAAADEFQCLQEELRPNPFATWAGTLEPERLVQIRRTDVADLLAAAAALRDGRHPVAGKHLTIITTPSPALAGTYLNNQIGWYAKGGSVAVLAPALAPFVADTVKWAQENATKKRNGPYKIAWERSDRDELLDLQKQLNMPERSTIVDALACARAMGVAHVGSSLEDWLVMQRRVLGRDVVTRAEVEEVIQQALASRRRIGRGPGSRLTAMSIHTAKNREFDGVVVLWPYQVAGSDDQKRRLLYNAITRAKRWCVILVQSESLRGAPPFA